MIDTENTTERIALVCWALFRNDAQLTTAEVAHMTSLTLEGARQMLLKISRIAPIYQDEKGLWKATDF